MFQVDLLKRRTPEKDHGDRLEGFLGHSVPSLPNDPMGCSGVPKKVTKEMGT